MAAALFMIAVIISAGDDLASSEKQLTSSPHFGSIGLTSLVTIPEIRATSGRRLQVAKGPTPLRPGETRGNTFVGDFPESGQTFRDCVECPLMVVIPTGAFTMGSDDYGDEKPRHQVTIRQPLAVGVFEVTFVEWEACVTDHGCKSNVYPRDDGWGRGRRPVINISWHQAKEYVAWLSRRTSKKYRLLSEAEWEYAARAGTTTKYAFGDIITRSQAQFSDQTRRIGGQTVEAGSFAPNRFGLHDMHGNVWEWVEDAWHPNYRGAPEDGSVWPGGDLSYRVMRGGSWMYSDVYLRSADRNVYRPHSQDWTIGFRVAREL